MRLGAAPRAIWRINLDDSDVQMTPRRYVDNADIPQALQIGLPSPFLRHRGVTVVWQLAQDGPPAAAKTAREEEVEDLRATMGSPDMSMLGGGRDAAAADMVGRANAANHLSLDS